MPDDASTGCTEPLAPVDVRARSKRQLIGALLVGYGAVEGTLLGLMSLMARQASNGTEPWLLPTLLVLSTPCCVAFVGQGLVRDRQWAYWAALLLPIAIVPVGAWWIIHPRGRPERLWVEFLGPLGGGALLALGTVALSAALLFTPRPVREGSQVP